MKFYRTLKFLLFSINKSYAMWPVIDLTQIAKTLEVIRELKQQYDEKKINRRKSINHS